MKEKGLLRILFVEDMPTDYEMAMREIRKEGIKFESIRTETKEDFLKGLEEFHPDLVVSDYSLPTFDGMTALKLSLELNPLLPFILCTGSMNEQTAVECMKAGATDYVLKEHIAKLPFAVTEALKNKADKEEKGKVREALRKSEERYRTLIENMGEGIGIVDENEKFVFVNPMAESIFGVGAGELIDKNLLEFGTKVSIDKVIKQTNTRKEGKRSVYELEINLKNGSKKVILVSATPNFENNKYKGSFGIFSDITERKMIEKELIDSENKYRTYIDSAPNGIFIIDNQGKYIDVNEKAVEILGYSKAELLTKNFADITPQSWLTYNFEKFKELELNGEMEIESEYLCKDGTTGWWMINTASLSEGRYLGFTTVTTERKKGETELKRINERFELATNAACLSVWEHDLITDIIKTNDNSNKIYGHTIGSNQIEYKEYIKFIYPDDLDIIKLNIEKGIKTDKNISYEFRIIKPDGEIRNISASAKIIKDKANKPIKIIGINLDVTDKKKAEEELIAAKVKAEESDRLKTAFLCNISHEIRTPMNAIVGFSALLKDPELSIEHRDQYCDIIDINSNNLLNIIEDILAISKIEAGILTIKPEEINVKQFLTKVYDENRIKNKNTLIDIKSNIDVLSDDIIINTDINRLRQVFTNLINNSLKFTKKGFVEIGCKINDQLITNNEQRITFYVKDTGIGISEEHMNIIFERFRQVEDTSIRNYGGLGLGLAISKEIVEVMGGKIWVESAPGKGSTFNFTLPYTTKKKKTTTKPLKHEITPDLSKIKILLAEDDEFNFKLFTIILERTGAKMIRAKDGLECVEMFEKNQDIDLVLMDIQMPGMNGLEATKILKKLRKEVPVIAQTAYAMESDRARCLEAGCDDIITKPINTKKLILLIKRYVG